ncbi:hypothetical protein [Ilyomonas limi]|uniref:hypothetical protein n=1 Tax=Ilyomonas limi TaxID=2575867 RepID=UPI0010C1ACE6|nr:hypothetical protein [Ilyomonas limi]
MNDNILHSGEELSDEQLKNYLKGYLSREDAHDIEERMVDDSFVNDAIEGLQQFSSNKKLDDYVRQLNQHLHQQMAEQKQRSYKRRLKDIPWIIQALIIVLLLCMLAYVVIMFVKEH